MHESANPCEDVMSSSPDAPELAEVTQAVAVVLSLAKMQGRPVLSPMAGGGNNRVYRVALPDRALVAKVYFQHPDDPRQRLDAEFGFIKHLWALGLRNIPQPIARLPMKQLGVYGALPGRGFEQGQVTQDHVMQAATFVREINIHREKFAGQRDQDHALLEDRPCVAHASDACFTLGEHLASIEARFSRLLAMTADTPARQAVVAFVESKLLPAWRSETTRFRHAMTEQGLTMSDGPTAEDIVLSPSDFGFHNALMDEAGQVAFHDFEYAGWDDPAKLICDFFTQVKVPVAEAWLKDFLDIFTPVLAQPDAASLRVRLLLPLYRLKWCAMPLMDLLPVSAARRAFALSASDEPADHARQLEKSQTLFEALSSKDD